MAAALTYRHVFGVKGNVKDNLHFVEDMGVVSIVYPAGHNVIKYNLDNKQQEFINGTDVSLGITAIAVAASCRLIAVAEEADTAHVYVYNLRSLYKRKMLTAPDSSSTRFECLNFSSDDSLLLTLSGTPDWTLSIWLWDKAKLLATIDVSPSPSVAIYGCTLNPVNPTKCVVYGQGVFKFFSIEPEKFVTIPNSAAFNDREPGDNLCHTWLPDDKSVLGTAAGELLLFQKEHLVSVLRTSPFGSAVRALAPFSRGFLAGGDGGIVRLYEPSESSEEGYTATKQYRIPHFTVDVPQVLTLAVSKSEELLAVSLSNCQLLYLNLPQADIKEDVTFQQLVAPVHGPPLGKSVGPGSPSDLCTITGLDVCVRKPLVATCGVDGTVRVWNYLEKTLELSKGFAEDPSSLAFHPSGLHLLVGFSDKLRHMNILMDDIRVFKEIPIKGCREVRYSNGGHMFAAVYSNDIRVYNTHTSEQLMSLRGHNNKVQSLVWTIDDYSLVSTGMDGAVYQWDLVEAKREGDFFNKGVNYTSAAVSADCTQVFAVGSDCKLCEIDLPNSQITREVEARIVLGQVQLSRSQTMLFAGASAADFPGTIRSYKFPPISADVFEYPAVSAPVTRMCLSHDDAYLFVAGADGALCVFEVRDKEGRIPHREADTGMPWSEEVLVTKSDLEERASAIAELKLKVAELVSSNDYAMRTADIEFQEKMKKVTEKYTTELDQDRQQYELLREEKRDLDHEFKERLKAMAIAHQAEMQKRESHYQSQIMKEVERFQQLQLETEMAKDRWSEKQSEIVTAHETHVAALTDEYEVRLEAARDSRVEVEDEKEGKRRDWIESNRQMEQDIDTEIELLKKRYEDMLAQEREATLKYKGENGIMRKKFSVLSTAIDDQREEIKRMQDKEKDLRAQIASLDAEIQNLVTIIHDKDTKIGEKEKMIYELKKRNQELEKFKFVLDYKIKELKRQIEPRENEIADMRRQIKEVDSELEAYHTSNAELDLLIGSLRRQLDDMQHTILKHRTKIAQQQSKIDAFHSELHKVVQLIQHPDDLLSAVTELYKHHVPKALSSIAAESEITSEYQRQKEYLERSVEALKKKLARDNVAHKHENMKVMQTNMSLIKEINALRRETKQMRMRKQAAATPIDESPRSREETPRHPGASSGAADTMAAQRDEIAALKAEIRRLEGVMVANRPATRERPVVL